MVVMHWILAALITVCASLLFICLYNGIFEFFLDIERIADALERMAGGKKENK
jgi:hypothetical protein